MSSTNSTARLAGVLYLVINPKSQLSRRALEALK